MSRRARALLDPAERMRRLNSSLVEGAHPLIGREADLTAIEALLAESALVTLCGPPGVGKTRLAQSFARLASERGEPHEVCFVDLSSWTTAEEIRDAILVALGREPDRGGTGLALARAMFEHEPMLLVLDNLEGAVGGAGQVIGELLELAPIGILGTSREGLDLRGERVYELRPLGEEDALRLLLERWPGGAPRAAEQHRADLMDVVRRLDRLPLAIELAAAWLDVLTPPQLRDRLADRFALLRRGPRDAPDRHRTLEAALDWSWRLLDPAEQAALAQCALFCDGFTLEAAEAVVAIERDRAPPVLDLVQRLVRKSVAYVAADHAGARRFALYQSVRDYAMARLAGSGEAATAAERHARYYAARGADWAAGLDGCEVAACMDRLEEEQANLAAIPDRLPGSELAAQTVLAMSHLFLSRRSLEDHLRLLDRGLAAAESVADDALAAATHLRRAEARVLRAVELERAIPDLASAIAIAARTGHAEVEAIARARRACVLGWTGEVEAAWREFDRARAVAAAAAGHADATTTYLWASWLAATGGAEPAEILGLLERARQLHRDAGRPRLEAAALAAIGLVRADLGDDERALEDLERAIRVLCDAGDRRGLLLFACRRATVLHLAGRLDEAQCAYEAVLSEARDLGSPAEGRAASDLSVLLCERGGYRDAERLAGRAMDLADPAPGPERAAAAGRLAALRALLGGPDGRAEIDALSRTDFPWLEAMLEVLRGLCEVAEAERAGRGGDPAAAARSTASAAQRLSASETLPARLSSLQTRLTIRWLRHELGRTGARIADPERAPPLVVGPGCEWFGRGERPRVELARRHVARRLLQALVAAHRRHPGAPLSSSQLIAASWPGEEIAPAAAAQRLWVATSTLRKLGLDGVLVTCAGGYALSTEIPIQLDLSEDLSRLTPAT